MKSPQIILSRTGKTLSFGAAVLLLLCTSATLAQLPSRARSGVQPSDQIVLGRILVKFNDGVGADQAHEAVAGQASRCIGEIPEIGMHIVELPVGAIDTVYVKAFQERPDVESAQVDCTISASDVGAAAAETVVAAAAPSHLWSKAFGSATNDQGNAVAMDASGNVYLTGSFTGTVNFGGQNLTCGNTNDGCLFLAKFALNGTPLWSKSFSNDYGSGKAVAIDTGGNVFLAGSFVNANFGCGILNGSIFAIKLAPDGSCLWSKRFKSVATGTGNAGGNDVINSLVTAGGAVYLAGKFGCSTNQGCAIDFGGGSRTSPQTPSYGGVFLAKLSGTDGSHNWSKAYGGVSGQDYATGVAVDAAGNAFITGYFSSSILNLGGANLANSGSSDVFLAKYQGSDGAPLWSKRFGGVSTDTGMGIAVDSGGAAVITGQFTGTASFGVTSTGVGVSLTSAGPFQPDVFLVRYASADGATVWAKRFGDTIADTGRAIKTDANGHIVITGYFMGSVDFGTGVPLTSSGGLDIFLAQYNAADGSAEWANKFGGVSSDVGLGIAVDNSGNTVLTGYFLGPVNFGGASINGGGALDLFVAKYGSTGTKTNTTTTLTSSLNPSTYGQTVTFTATVAPSAATGPVTFLDGGVTLGTSSLSGGVATFSIFTLAAGSHSITASYGGDANYNGSASVVLSQTVNASTKINTTTGLTSSRNPSTLGQLVTFTANVSPSAATGTVTFLDGAITLGTGTLSGGTATFSTTSLAAGTHSITARYNGNSNYNASTSGTLSQTVNTSTSDTTPPTISILSPVNGASVNGTIQVTVNASDNVGVTRVELYVDGALKATSSTAPFTTSWKVPGKPGAHTLQTKAYDAAGNMGVSQLVTVTK